MINRYATEFLNAVNLFKDEAVTGVCKINDISVLILCVTLCFYIL